MYIIGTNRYWKVLGQFVQIVKIGQVDYFIFLMWLLLTQGYLMWVFIKNNSPPTPKMSFIFLLCNLNINSFWWPDVRHVKEYTYMHRYINIQVYVCFLKMCSMKPFFFIDNLPFYWMIKHSGLSLFIKWQQIILYLHLNLAVIIAITYFQITVSSLPTVHSFYLFMSREQINIIGIQTRQASVCVYLQRNHGKHSLPLTLFSLLYTCNYLLINFQQNYWHTTSLNEKEYTTVFSGGGVFNK